MIDVYLKDSIFAFEIVFTVPSWHERVFSCDEIGVERREEEQMLRVFNAS